MRHKPASLYPDQINFLVEEYIKSNMRASVSSDEKFIHKVLFLNDIQEKIIKKSQSKFYIFQRYIVKNNLD